MNERETIFRAIAELANDDEFANLVSREPAKGADRVIAYLVRRGVNEIDAALLGLAYMQGQCHEVAWAQREMARHGIGTT